MNIDTPIEHVYLIGPKYAEKLTKLGIISVGDLLWHIPVRYLDYRLISKIGHVQPGETVTIKGTITESKNIFTKTGKRIQLVRIEDETGSIEIIWYNQPFLIKALKTGLTINASGKIDWYGSKIVMQFPDYEIVSPDTKMQKSIHTGRLVPIYPETSGISSKWLRSRINFLLNGIPNFLEEYLPKTIREQNNLISQIDAFKKIHFPESEKDIEEAKKRLEFDELFKIQLVSLYAKQTWEKETIGNKISIDQEKILEFINKLPFILTNAQNKAVKEILTDLSLEKPMNRLLEGDVGSGKTVVAAIAMYAIYLNGYKSVLMAPTEILAQQHYQTISTLLTSFGIKVQLLTGSTKKKINSIDVPDIWIGTHAVLWQKELGTNIGLVIIDEQHRFGVEQRQKLKEKGINPHLLSMTATPIPRTIALTLYGELDLSVIDEMPKGRSLVKTWLVPVEKRMNAYNWIEKQIKDTGGQVFIICPLIEESESLLTTKAAKKEYEYIKKTVFPNLNVGLIHGKLKMNEKQKVLGEMRNGKLHVLIATPVVEVGIDIPNATIMIIEASERFGLAQLHQLRGRVGRGNKQSYCLLFTENTEDLTIKRLKALETNFIGSKLAELDLKLRGPGEIYGTRQHGKFQLKIANILNERLIIETKSAVNSVLKDIDSFPLLKQMAVKGTMEQIITKGD